MQDLYSDRSFIERLHRLLHDVRRGAGESFSGVGVVVADSAEALPIFPLRSNSGILPRGSAVELLSSISHEESEFHDGFHVLSPTFDVLLVSMYFSPPIIPEIDVDPTRQPGGRYMAALFGSAIPGVLASGIASRRNGLGVFRSGREVSFEP